MKPHYVAKYAYDLATKFNDFYERVPVLKAETQQLAATRLALVRSAAMVLKNALSLLGIEAPEVM
jgi:arginyl-tRNA synthetase